MANTIYAYGGGGGGKKRTKNKKQQMLGENNKKSTQIPKTKQKDTTSSGRQ